jgi:yecA family protein
VVIGAGSGSSVTGASAGTAFTYSELDELLRGTGRDGFIGMSAIDGLIAALVAAPSFVHPDEWVPLIFGNRRPNFDENSPECRAVKTIVNRYNEVSSLLADRPGDYQPIFMVDEKGGIVVRDWVVGFMRGISLCPDEWGECILLTKNRALLTPILVYAGPTGVDLLPDMPASEKRSRQASAYQQIAGAVAAVRTVCNPFRAAEANRTSTKSRRPRRARQ